MQNYNSKFKILLSALIFLASLLQVSLGVGKVVSHRLLIDFSVYYQATKALVSGLNPYTSTYYENIPFNYPPSSFLFFIPMTFLTPQTAQVILTIFSLLFLLLSGLLLTPKIHWALRLIVLSLLLQNFPSKFTLVMGQINLIVLVLLVASFKKDKEKHQVMSGILFGLASMIKLIPLPLALYFFIRRKIASLIVGLALVLFTNVGLIYFFREVKIYFSDILPSLMSITISKTPVYDQSLRAFFTRIGIKLAPELSIIIGITLLILAVIKYRKDHHELTFFSLILAISTITNSFAWQHHFVFLFPAFIVAVISSIYSKNVLRRILLLISFILLSYHFPDPNNPWTTNPILVSHTLIGSLLIIILILVDNFKTKSDLVKKYQRSV